MNTFARSALTVMLCLVAGPAAAQPAVSALIGRVVDQQAAAVPGATITVQQTSTAAIFSASVSKVSPDTRLSFVSRASAMIWKICS